MRVIGPVLVAHYLAAFTALGMPVFMPRVLAELAPGAPTWLAGVLYVLPTLCTALTATTWGRLADRYGRRLSLLRAQMGLALGFTLAGFAPDIAWFVVALVIQGSCGGSLAAANAYLSTQFAKEPGRGSLARALDWTQFSARLAMVSAPALLGVAMAWVAHRSSTAIWRCFRWLHSPSPCACRRTRSARLPKQKRLRHEPHGATGAACSACSSCSASRWW